MKAILGEVLREFYEFGIPEDVKPRAVDYLEKKNAATVVTGMRRTGKTYVTYQRMRALVDSGIPIERIVHVNFDDDRLKGLKLEHLRFVGDVHAELFPDAARERCWYFLDELQDVKGWELYARRLLDSHLVQLCLTGSSSKLLSGEIATHMRGRSIDIEVFPLSFAEFLSFNSLVKKVPPAPYSSRTAGLLRHAMQRYLDEGGFPDVQGDDYRIRIKTLQGYVDAVLYRDVIERHEVPSVQSLRYTLEYIKYNFAHKISTRAISGVLKGLGLSDSREYIADYLDWLEQAYLIHRVPIRTDSLSVRRMNPDKFYLVDTGLARAVTPKSDAARGWLLENLVFLALRRGDNKIEYFNTRKGDEVDFLVTDKLSKKRRLVQVAWDMSSPGMEARELSALKAARNEIKVDDCTVVTWDEERETDGIKIVPAWKWCLDESPN
ncbi:MAG: ATP-binding protein [Kiritimatiellae bacterium]|nr:ATP-binding protein [Kiritimatiellia bacterium]